MPLDPSLQIWLDMARASLTQNLDPESVFARIAEAVGPKAAAEVRAEVERQAGQIKSLKIPRSLSSRQRRDWYTGPMASHRFWPALGSYLLNRKGWDPEVVRSIDHASSKIVGMMEPPGLSEFRTRGLVLGHVQSGKTANFTAVISKAADVSYKAFIVLSGLHNTLRAQTQRRLNSELSKLNPDHWISLTDKDNDFGHLPISADSVLTATAPQRVLAVVKKNSPRLQRLKEWLEAASPTVLRSCPVIVIDDEADQASLNAAKYEDERTRINELIIEILSILPRHVYLGYTATPFANVLVDPETVDDLYPRDFIIDLPKPKRYFGTETIFGRNPLEYDDRDDPDDGLDMLRRIKDDEVAHLRPRGRKDRDSFEPALVESLEQSIRYFWMATAARRFRGQTDEHSSMLIHTSMLTRVHDAFDPLLEAFKGATLQRLLESSSTEESRFRMIWENEHGRTPEDPDHPPTRFDDLRQHLKSVVNETLVCIENNRSIERLDYSDDHRIRIVVGGNTLSRGLTLEGLVVSYFVRSAGAYDTLLQMGRWFGYRTGYSDLPRIWLTAELERYFRDLALVEAEIRRDIQRYEDDDLTPEELAVRIRVHPTLAVTSRLKMQSAKTVQHSYSGDRPQTILFDHRDLDVLRHNRAAASRLLSRLRSQLGEPERKGSNLLFRAADGEDVLRFFKNFEFHPENQRLREDLLVKYVTKQREKGRLGRWSIGVIGKAAPGANTVDLGLSSPVPLIHRSRLRNSERSYAYVGAIMSPGDRSLDLDGESEVREDGLVLIYPIDKDSKPRPGATKRVALEAADHVIGVAVVFPEVPPDEDTPGYVAVELPAIDPDTIEEPEDLPDDEDYNGERSDGS